MPRGEGENGQLFNGLLEYEQRFCSHTKKLLDFMIILYRFFIFNLTNILLLFIVIKLWFDKGCDFFFKSHFLDFH